MEVLGWCIPTSTPYRCRVDKKCPPYRADIRVTEVEKENTVKAAVLNTINEKFDIEEIQIDSAKGREVLVEVRASGLCHSDLHLAEHDFFGTPLPAVLGHELAGVVKGLGPEVREFTSAIMSSPRLSSSAATALRALGDTPISVSIPKKHFANLKKASV
jgi:Alcohol dehydrogenase GroES-like domain